MRLAVDASNYGLGVVLSYIFENGEEKSIVFVFCIFFLIEQNYLMIEKEVLVIIFGMKKFYQYFFSRRFILLIVYKFFIYIFGLKYGILVFVVFRLQRWVIQLVVYIYDIEYRVFKNYGNVDVLLRLSRKIIEESEDWLKEGD